MKSRGKEKPLEINENGTLSVSSEVIFGSEEFKKIIRMIKEYNDLIKNKHNKSAAKSLQIENISENQETLTYGMTYYAEYLDSEQSKANKQNVNLN